MLNSIIVLAATTCEGTQTDLGCIPSNPGEFSTAIYAMGLQLLGAVAIIFIIYGGYMILSSGGNSEKIKTGRSYVIYAIVGIILALAGFTFYQAVIQNILVLPVGN